MGARRAVIRTGDWGVETTGEQHPHWFYLMVYGCTADLQRAARRYHNDQDFGNAAGCVQGKYGRVNRFCGVIRLSEEQVGTEVVAHEAVHATLVIVRQARAEVGMDYQVPLGEDCDPLEEAVAYLVGELSRKIVNALYDMQVFTRDVAA